MKCSICDIEMHPDDAVRFGPEWAHSFCFNILFWYATIYSDFKKPTLEPTTKKKGVNQNWLTPCF